MIYPWHLDTWQKLTQLRERLPHALLLYGNEGIGKWALAQHFGQSLLCEALQVDDHPCGTCPSCQWFSQYGHPDYRRVRPAYLEEAEEETAEENNSAAEESADKKSIKSKASKEIRIEQIRALFNFINLSTHRHGRRVVILYPVETLNTIAGNGLLKMLEEPTPNTIFLLIAHRIDQLLPTILSRCQKLQIPTPSQKEALPWLQQQGIEQPHNALAQMGGAPLAAAELAQSAQYDEILQVLEWLANPALENALKMAELSEKLSLMEWVTVLQRWLYDVFCYQICSTVRYHPQCKDAIAAISQKIKWTALLELLKNLQERRQVANHPLSAKLFVESMLLEYCSALYK